MLPNMSSSLSMFSIESNSAERERASLENSLSRELEMSGMNFGNNNNDDGESSCDEQFMGGMSSLLLRDYDLDEGISAAAEELDAALNELDGAGSTTPSSIVESIELGRGLPTGSPPEPEFLTTARKTSQRTSPSEMHRHVSTSFSPVQPKQLTTRRAYSQSTPKRAPSLEVISERSLSDLNRARSPAESRFASKNISTAKIPTSFKNTQDLLMSLGMNTEETDNIRVSRRRNREAVALAPESADDASIRLPDITGISSLISGDDTKLSFGKVRHKNIGSIPISDDDQAILSALRTMQERIRQLETKNESYRTAAMSLESSLRQAQKQYETATLKTKSLEQQLEQRRREMIGSITAAEKQKIQKALEKERQSWQEKQSNLKLRIESLERELSFQNVRYQRLEDERNESVRSLAEALAEIDRVKELNNSLKSQLSRETQTSKLENENLSARQRIHREATSLKKSRTSKTNNVDEDERGTGVESNDETADLKPVPKPTRKRVSNSRSKSIRVARKKPSKVESSQLRNPSLSSRHRRNPEPVEESEYEENDDDDLSSSSVYDSEDESDVETTYSGGPSDTEPIAQRYRRYQTKARKHAPARTRSHKAKPEVQARGAYFEDIPRPNISMRKAMDSISQHNPANCTVCSRRRYRKYQPGSNQQPSWQYPTGNTPKDQAESEEHWEEENTVRPSMRPETAVTSVLSQLEDEFRHLKLQYQSQVDKYEQLDPAVSKRRRKAVVGRLKEIIEELETKADQIYALYDVLESKGFGPGPWLGAEMSV
ncbi:centrosome microtubule-binding domain of Cep57-domain-containing protein [Lipomyces tetrasporus]|uniref:Centrosome microtubule-binding domain of Cep57-domain-containing protein n=1 Tax=Lipomyces tetrasporus TaxID=54092 RepID=A0AAD7VTJ9_9ASCO|nr:centrosome microtubule-binding domain of Cep57-domain-containing protein [Lipomyces tetrasporus]KAJ8101051.1 centrosome microtubule-binding domain of Cep57-domain-containing protein [Lipomyces tetrasporus]